MCAICRPKWRTSIGRAPWHPGPRSTSNRRAPFLRSTNTRDDHVSLCGPCQPMPGGRWPVIHHVGRSTVHLARLVFAMNCGDSTYKHRFPGAPSHIVISCSVGVWVCPLLVVVCARAVCPCGTLLLGVVVVVCVGLYCSVLTSLVVVCCCVWSCGAALLCDDVFGGVLLVGVRFCTLWCDVLVFGLCRMSLRVGVL
jgi:hypothetical protein